MKKMLLIAVLTGMASTLSAAKLTVKNFKGAAIYVTVNISKSGWSPSVPVNPGGTKTFNYPGKTFSQYKWKIGNSSYNTVNYPVSASQTKSVKIQ